MIWPPYSPDIDPIENLWGVLKNQLRCSNCTDKFALKVALKESDKINTLCQNLITNMPKRINEIIKSKGGPIKY